MSSWERIRNRYQGEFDILSQMYSEKTSKSDLELLKAQCISISNTITEILQKELKAHDTSELLATSGKLQQQIQQLYKIKEKTKVDVESAIARDELLRSRDTDLTSHQLFLLKRPVRKAIIPYLWVLSILFIGVALVIFKWMAPPLPSDSFINGESFSMMIAEFFENKFVYISIIVSLLIVIFFLSLKVAGVFGK
jgi:hypothetical protein